MRGPYTYSCVVGMCSCCYLIIIIKTNLFSPDPLFRRRPSVPLVTVVRLAPAWPLYSGYTMNRSFHLYNGLFCFFLSFRNSCKETKKKKKKKKKHGPDSVSGSLGSSTTIERFTEKNTPSGLILSVSRRLTRGCRVWAFFLLLFIYWMRLQRWSRPGCNWHCFCRNSLPQALWIQ